MKKNRFDTPLLFAAFIPIVIFCIIISLIIYSTYSQRRYWSYIKDLSASTQYAYLHDGLTVTDSSETFSVTGEKTYLPYQLIVSGGRGKPQKTVPDNNPDLTFDFGNGSHMQIWNVPVKNADTPDGYGVLIRYQNRTGKVYTYDTDKIRFARFDF